MTSKAYLKLELEQRRMVDDHVLWLRRAFSAGYGEQIDLFMWIAASRIVTSQAKAQRLGLFFKEPESQDCATQGGD